MCFKFMSDAFLASLKSALALHVFLDEKRHLHADRRADWTHFKRATA